MEPGENVKLVFKNALHHYNRILQQLKDEKEFELSDPIFEGDVLNNISKNSEIINKLDSTGGLDAVDHNRKFLCDCLRGYILYLEKIKDEISSKFQNTYSLPIMDLNKVDNELELANRILVNSFKDQIG
jgi:hypothetical protein